jgi:hypothetical protein
MSKTSYWVLGMCLLVVELVYGIAWCSLSVFYELSDRTHQEYLIVYVMMIILERKCYHKYKKETQ